MTAGLKKLLRRGLIGSAAVTALIGVMHAPFARSVLMKVSGCPVGHASAADIENVRKASALQVRGDAAAPAPSRTALGFAIGRTTRAEVVTWANEHGLRCEAKREESVLACTDVPATFLPEKRDESDGRISQLVFGFTVADARLVNVMAMSNELRPGDAAFRATHAFDRMKRELGAPSSADGDFTAERLSRGGFATSTVSYRFTDYIANLTATSFDNRGVMLREHYVAVGE